MVEDGESLPLLARGKSPAAAVSSDDAGEDVVDRRRPEVPKESNSWLFTGMQITNTMIGSGILAFPLALAKLGWVLFAMEIVLFAAAVYTTVVMMIEVGRKKGIMDYSLLTESVFGAKVARVLDFCIALSNMGALLTYFNVIGFLGSKVVRYWSGGHIVVSSYSGFLVLVALLDLPLVFLRSYGELTPISAGSLLFITFAVFFVAIQGQIDARDDHFHTALPGPRSVMDAFEGLGTISYGITCQAVVFEAYQSTKRADKGMFLKGSMALATAGGGLLLTLMAIWGYAAFGQDSESNIFANFNVDDVAVQVAMLVVVLHLALYIPNDFIIMRLFAVNLYDPKLNVLQLTPWAFRVATLALYAIPVGIMASVPEDDVLGVFSYTIDLTGDLPLGFSCFALPAALYLAVFDGTGSTTTTTTTTATATAAGGDDPKVPEAAAAGGGAGGDGNGRPLWYAACVVLATGTILMVVCPVMDTITFVNACTSDSGCSSY
jgi:amino acid permease